ncbi:MAG: DMT family transporter [Oscillospiraceae bacterium]|jgi:drug/metabolite transporter (DMT)-like permease|nr:DMT family transporter [Oscillospiraceae bacterium]
MIYLLVATVIWGSSFVAQRAGMETIGPLTFASARYTLSTAALAVWFAVLAIRRKSKGEKLANLRGTLIGGILCGLLSFAATTTQQIGIVTASSGKSGFLTAMYIVFAPIVGIMFGKKTSRLVWLAVALSFVGMAFVCYEPGIFFIKQDLWLVSCAILFTFQIMLVDKYAAKVDAILFMLVSTVLCMVLTIACMFVWENPIKLGSFPQILANWFPLMYSGVLSGAVAYTLQVYGQRKAHPSVASLVMSLEAVFAAVFGWLILRESMSALQITGCALMFAATVAATSPQWLRRVYE